MKTKVFTIMIILALLIAALPAVSAGASGTPVVSEGYDSQAINKGGVRYRNFRNPHPGLEVMIGKSGFGSYGGQYSTIDFGYNGAWRFGETVANKITFDYDQTAGKITTTVLNTSQFSQFYNVGDLGQLNYFKIFIACNQAGTTVGLKNVLLDGSPLPDFNCVAPGSKNWMVTGVDVSAGFTMTGDLVLTGPGANNETNKLEIWVGYSEPPDMEGPITSNVSITTPADLNGPATLTASVDDTTTGGAAIASAEYTLNGGAWTSMTAADGTFDEVAEEVIANFTATQIGENTACVRGTDALGNTGGEICQTFVVSYVFDGFFQPIDNINVNIAKAGQAIPAKWRLTDYFGVPISDSTSFVGLNSYPVSCTDFTGNPLDAIEEYAPGSSGLQYNGDGYWQFNWKTPKTYAGNCRAMYVEFDSGNTSPTVYFKFK